MLVNMKAQSSLYPFVLCIYSVLTSTDQRRFPFLVNPLFYGQVADRVPATGPLQVRLPYRRSSDSSMFDLRQSPEGDPQPVYQPAAAVRQPEGRHHGCARSRVTAAGE